MTKTFELNVGKDEAKKTLKEILADAERIRNEYVIALNDFDAPLKPIEDKYDVQLHRLSSIAKEDVSLAREMGRLDVFMQNSTQGNLLQKYFEKKVSKENLVDLNENLPAIMSLGENALLDFFMANDASVKRIWAYHAPVFILQPQSSDLNASDDFPGGVANIRCSSGTYFVFDNKKKLLVPRSSRSSFHIQNYIKSYNEQNGQGLYILTSFTEKGRWLLEAPLIKTLPEMFLRTDDATRKSAKVDGAIYKVSAKTKCNTNKYDDLGIERLNPEKMAIFQQFIRPERAEEYFKGYFLGENRISQASITRFLSFYETTSRDVKMDGFTLTFKKNEEKLNQARRKKHE